MYTNQRLPLLLLFLLTTLIPGQADASPPGPGPLRVRVTLGPSLATGPVSGRLLLLVAPATPAAEMLDIDFKHLDRIWLAAQDITGLTAGVPVDLDTERLTFPAALSALPPGRYQAMAVLDRDHSLARTQVDPGDWHSRVVSFTRDAASDPMLELTLERVVPRPPVPTQLPAGIEAVKVPSMLLSTFYGRPMELVATVVLPPPEKRPAGGRLATVYVISGFGASESGILRRVTQLGDAIRRGDMPPLAYVLLTGALPTGHSVFADSVNNGPWGRALVEELVPALEQKFPLDPRPRARFVSGHSSGGWASLWLVISHPEFFAGAWATSPDPVDFHNFLGGADTTPDTHDNVLRNADGKPRPFMRVAGEVKLTLAEYFRLERVLGDYGGVVQTFDWVFSPRGDDGRPLPLFDRATGAVDPDVARAWEKYDIGKQLEARWSELGPRLHGKLHIVCGAEDNFYLDLAVTRLCSFLAARSSGATCTMVPGKDHFNLYERMLFTRGGLLARMVGEMQRSLTAP